MKSADKEWSMLEKKLIVKWIEKNKSIEGKEKEEK